ncbi:MAG TPA: helix-turn-helix domain-containing protein [Desulfitobacterium dehalogenans]|uniref:Helix-turn-helix domain-containing protein n=1 Tax=Desulfitobacterium dehalogenans TaxID=36854 RepID=A0A7C7D426_9FIRM|nr:helix-turn-helix domain-containing protein [Desulfitobacterium dehalogenans]
MEYITVQETAEKWGVSIRRIQYLCRHNMIMGAVRFGKVWSIPKEAEKPKDSRYKTHEEKQKSIAQSLKSVGQNKEVFEKIVEFFPYPIQVFTPDGTSVITNEAFLRVFKIPSKHIINGKYNILQDSDTEKWGTKEYLLRAFQGEAIQLNDIKVPTGDLSNKCSDKELRFESIFQNITAIPIYNDHNQLAYVVSVFITSRHYHDREEIMNSKEYIESHWLKEFDIDEVAAFVSLSKYHLTRLFKKHTGFTPYGYYQDIKINKLKEKLCDINLSISRAFADCGVDYNGNFAKIFKEKVGMTPSQYKASVTKR